MILISQPRFLYLLLHKFQQNLLEKKLCPRVSFMAKKIFYPPPMVWKHLFLASWIFVSFSKSIKTCLLPGLRGGWVPLLIFCLWCPYQKYLQKYLNHDTLACFSTTESLEQLCNYYLSQKLSNCFLFILFLFWIDKTKFVFPQSQIYKLIKYISLHVKERIQFDSITNIR